MDIQLNTDTKDKVIWNNKSKRVFETEVGPAIVKRHSRHLSAHAERNRDTTHVNYKIHHILYNPYTFVNAYAAISKNKGALTKGVISDQQVNLFFGQSNANDIADRFKKGTYRFSPVRRTWIDKPGKKAKRPIDTPTQEDRVVQEAIRGILESIYEPEFREFSERTNNTVNNFGFRPLLNTWKAANSIKIWGQATSFAIEGDISKAYNTISHEKLLSILSFRIKDDRFLRMIDQLLKSGIMDKHRFEHSLEGTPQGGIVSPLLFNIYMFELDKFVFYNIIQLIEKPDTKLQRDKEWQRIGYAMNVKLKQWRASNKDEEAKNLFYKPFKQLQLQRAQLPSYKVETVPKKAAYFRYADDWVYVHTGTHDETEKIKKKISQFLKDELSLTLSEEKTLITKLQDGIHFLGFYIVMTKPKNAKLIRVLRKAQPKSYTDFNKSLQRTTSRKIYIFPDKNRLHTRLVQRGFCSKGSLFPIGVRSWTSFDEFEIVLKYRRIMVGLANYYRNCDQVHALNRVSYILQYSCAKTLATRLKITMSQVFKKYGKNLTIERTFSSKGKEVKKTASFATLADLRKEGKLTYNENVNVDYDPFKIMNHWRTKLKTHMECCICGSEDRIAHHHINSLRSIKLSKRDKYSYIRSMT